MMVNKGFPQFSRMQDTAYVETLKNYNLHDFILEAVARQCNSPLSPKGRLYLKLQSMNNESLELLHKIFVKCENDCLGKFAQYRFFGYVSSYFPKCNVVINGKIAGKKHGHTVPIAIKENEMCVAIAATKPNGSKVGKKEIRNFYNMLIDIKNSDCGELRDAIYCSSAGFKPDAVSELKLLSKSNACDVENKIHFKTVLQEKDMFVVQSQIQV